MGIPYSKQINAAFDQVTPLVAAAFEVLQTTKNISILLAAIQVLTVILLAMILVVLAVLLVTINPDLEKERQTIVTPMMKWFSCWLMPDCHPTGRLKTFFSFVVVFALFAGAWTVLLKSTNVEKPESEEPEPTEEDDATKSDGEKSDGSEKSKSKK